MKAGYRLKNDGIRPFFILTAPEETVRAFFRLIDEQKVTIKSPQILHLDGGGLSADDIKHHPLLTSPIKGGGLNGYNKRTINRKI